MEAKKITRGAAINDLAAGSFLTLEKIKPAGALQARRLANGGVVFYWRYTFAEKTERVMLGTYDSSLPPRSHEPVDGRCSILAATRIAERLAAAHLNSLTEGGHAAIEQKKLADRSRARAERDGRKLHTLERLLTAYCDRLKSLGRPSHADARSIFKLHVIEAWPGVAALPAGDVTEEQIADMLRRLFELEKGRTANKLRSYIRAAFEIARKAKTDPKIAVTFKAFNIRSNPAAETEGDSTENRADKNPLRIDDLRRYWKRIEKSPGIKGASLRLHLLTGAQRIEQLVRLKTADTGPQSILLFDGKGRPGKSPRPHELPLTTQGARALKECAPVGEYALSTDGGETHISATTLSRWAVDAAEGVAGFQTKRLRSGVETLLASIGITEEIRGRLQSHGISGVQSAHYNGHDYLDEKLKALRALYDALAPKRSTRTKTQTKS